MSEQNTNKARAASLGPRALTTRPSAMTPARADPAPVGPGAPSATPWPRTWFEAVRRLSERLVGRALMQGPVTGTGKGPSPRDASGEGPAGRRAEIRHSGTSSAAPGSRAPGPPCTHPSYREPDQGYEAEARKFVESRCWPVLKAGLAVPGAWALLVDRFGCQTGETWFMSPQDVADWCGCTPEAFAAAQADPWRIA